MNLSLIAQEAERQFTEMNRELALRRRYFLQCWVAVAGGLASWWEPRKEAVDAEREFCDGCQLVSVRAAGEKGEG